MKFFLFYFVIVFLFSPLSFAVTLFVEDWNSGTIDTAKWDTVVGPKGKAEFVKIGDGDYALALTEYLTYETSILTKLSFARGQNLRITYKIWGDKSRDWLGHTYPSGACVVGPWHIDFFEHCTNATLEAGLCKNYPDFTFDENRTYHQKPLRDNDAFSVAWAKALSKDSAITLRVTLGNKTGAKFEWFDGCRWHESVDTREQAINKEMMYVSGNGYRVDNFSNPIATGIDISYKPQVKAGFAPTSSWMLIDDIVIENDAQNKNALIVTDSKKFKGPGTPWTHQNFNNKNEDFQFAIVSDLTGGARKEVFQEAIKKLNLLQPEFVITVGDLVDGYTIHEKFLDQQLQEFDLMLKPLQMPFYYVPGNHDLIYEGFQVNHKDTAKVWRDRYGKDYYHFIYKDVLFLCLNTNDEGHCSIGSEQVSFAKRILKDHREVRWTFVFMHDPVWLYEWNTNWQEIKDSLQNRKYTVFAGHFHLYTKYVRNDKNYYVLSATGGSSTLNGHKVDGQFDHIVWVTMKDNGPVIANLLLEGILDDNPYVMTPEQLNKKLLNPRSAAKADGTYR